MVKEIDDVLTRISSGVYIVGTAVGEKKNALTAAWVCRASFEPAMVVIGIGKSRYTHELLEKSNNFAVNVLAEDQVDLAKHFGKQSGKNVDKFKGIEFKKGKSGAPLLKDCIGYLDCEKMSSFDVGDHTFFAGKIIDAKLLKPDAKPMIYDRGRFY